MKIKTFQQGYNLSMNLYMTFPLEPLGSSIEPKEGPSTRGEEPFPKIYMGYPHQSKDIYSGELEEVSNVNINFTNTTVFLFLVVFIFN